MDVTAASGHPRPGAQIPAAADVASGSRKPHADVAPPERRPSLQAIAAEVERNRLRGSSADGLLVSEIPLQAHMVTQVPQEGADALKFEVVDADVLARFSIDEATKRVVVSMYQRDTGELIKEFPPRPVLDMMAALAGRGLAIDVTS